MNPKETNRLHMVSPGLGFINYKNRGKIPKSANVPDILISYLCKMFFFNVSEVSDLHHFYLLPQSEAQFNLFSAEKLCQGERGVFQNDRRGGRGKCSENSSSV